MGNAVHTWVRTVFNLVPEFSRMPDFHQAMQGIVTIFFGGGALYLLFKSHNRPSIQSWAAGIIGTILGYWFR
jgi:hypothetical protein